MTDGELSDELTAMIVATANMIRREDFDVGRLFEAAQALALLTLARAALDATETLH